MDARDLEKNMLVWWKQPRGDKLLCRVHTVARDFVGLRIAAATAEQVVRTGFGVGEHAYPKFDAEQFEKV